MRHNRSRTWNKGMFAEKGLGDMGVRLGAPEIFVRRQKKLFICNTAAEVFFYKPILIFMSAIYTLLHKIIFLI